MNVRPKLAARGVGVTKGGVRILDGVGLEVESGTFLALLGRDTLLLDEPFGALDALTRRSPRPSSSSPTTWTR